MLLLGPYAPHLSEELWGRLGHEGTNAYAEWQGFPHVHFPIKAERFLALKLREATQHILQKVVMSS